MNWLDVVLGLILIASIVTSFRKGLSREVIALVSVCLALLLGVWLYGYAGGYLLPYLSSRAVANFAGFAIVFCGVMLLGSIVSLMVGKFLKITGLSFFDHALGAGFGVVRGILVSIALVMGIMAFSQGEQPPASVVQSRTAPYVVGAARVIAAMAPYELKEGFRKTYERVKTAWAEAARKGIRGGPDGDKAKNERQI
jgi:membrane protein required for colicin V production